MAGIFDNLRKDVLIKLALTGSLLGLPFSTNKNPEVAQQNLPKIKTEVAAMPSHSSSPHHKKSSHDKDLENLKPNKIIRGLTNESFLQEGNSGGNFEWDINNNHPEFVISKDDPRIPPLVAYAKFLNSHVPKKISHNWLTIIPEETRVFILSTRGLNREVILVTLLNDAIKNGAPSIKNGLPDLKGRRSEGYGDYNPIISNSLNRQFDLLAQREQYLEAADSTNSKYNKLAESSGGYYKLDSLENIKNVRPVIREANGKEHIELVTNPAALDSAITYYKTKYAPDLNKIDSLFKRVQTLEDSASFLQSKHDKEYIIQNTAIGEDVRTDYGRKEPSQSSHLKKKTN